MLLLIVVVVVGDINSLFLSIYNSQLSSKIRILLLKKHACVAVCTSVNIHMYCKNYKEISKKKKLKRKYMQGYYICKRHQSCLNVKDTWNQYT